MHTRSLLPALAILFFAFPATAVEISGGTEQDRASMASVAKKWLDSYASGDLDGRYLILYEKVDGSWKVLRDMDNLDPVAN